MLLGGLRFQQQNFAPEIARLNASSLLLSVLVLLTPSAIHFTSDGLPKAAIQNFSYAAAILLLIFYGLSLIFSLKSQQDVERLNGLEARENQPQPVSGRNALATRDRSLAKFGKPVTILLICTVALVVISEILVGSLEETVKVLACIIHEDFGKSSKALARSSSSDLAEKQSVF